jgi:hypothetical protein
MMSSTLRVPLTIAAVAIAAVLRAAPPSAPAAEILFDDFSYAKADDMTQHGWCLRSKPGWPGIPGAHWGPEAIAIVDDPTTPGNRLVRMTAFTDGTGEHTQQAQICQQRKFLEGTYASRVYFSDKPVSGPAGDETVQSFYTICPLIAPMDPTYSEIDFEYLSAGGWGEKGPTLFGTTWYTFSPEPNWKKDNTFNTVSGSRAGWHVLVAQVHGGKVQLFLDGKRFAKHSGKYFPRSIMTINYNLWFIKEAVSASHERREYREEIDWLYFEKGVVSPKDVEARVANLRKNNVKFADTVVAPTPKLDSPCDF